MSIAQIIRLEEGANHRPFCNIGPFDSREEAISWLETNHFELWHSDVWTKEGESTFHHLINGSIKVGPLYAYLEAIFCAESAIFHTP